MLPIKLRTDILVLTDRIAVNSHRFNDLSALVTEDCLLTVVIKAK